ncbi:MAG: hypothetical protein EXS29_08910 [Pedosphaera sp.]|nr:hypothetical protein [Pedosphaera sp.]
MMDSFIKRCRAFTRVEPCLRCGIALLVSAMLFAGCGREDGGRKSEHQPVPLFSEKKGILLPAEMKRLLGVETAQVTEKAVRWHFEKPAQVYRAANGSEPAAAVVLLNENETAALRTGGSIILNAGGDSAIEIHAALVRFDATASAALGQVEALIEFPDAERRWQRGDSLTATFAGSRTNLALAAPESAVIRVVGGAFVYVAKGEHFVRAAVKSGATANGWVEITNGLLVGDLVAAKGAGELWMIELSALKGGTPCCPVETKKSEK